MSPLNSALSEMHDIRTERLLLRRPKDSDWKAISVLRTDPEINKYVKRSSAPTQCDALAFISRINNDIDKGTIRYWAITLHDDDVMIGSICLWNFSMAQKTAEVGYDLHSRHQGVGIMSEAISTVLKLGFISYDLESITAYTHKNNARSKILLMKHGFDLTDRKDAANKDNLIYQIRKSNQYR